MIPARKRPWFEAWFSRHAAARIQGAFAGLHVAGLDRLREAAARGPVLVVSNHTSWWDPLVALALIRRRLGLDGYAMMDARNLRKLPFFGLVGAFGVELDQPEDGRAALRYGESLLDRPGRVLWIFPQGAERPSTARPLGFKAGSAVIATRRPDVAVIPLALRYEHGGRERPDLWVEIGPPVEGATEVGEARERQERAVTALLERVDQRLLTGDRGGVETWLAWREPPLARLATRILAWLTRR